MKIRVIRDYSGEEGVGPDKDVFAGTEHSVIRARGNQLKANGLVEILEDEEEDAPVEDEQQQQQQPAPATAVAPKPANKAAPKPRNKASQA